LGKDGGVDFSLLDLKRRLLAKAARSDGLWVIPRASARGISSVYVFLVESEEGQFTSSIKRGDSSQRRLGVTHNGKGQKTPFPTFPQIHKVFFGWSWRRGLIPPPLIVVLSEAKDLPILGRGKRPLPN